MIHGLVLAAGDATRMPNKAILPLRTCKPVITSSVDFCLRNGCEAITVVHKGGGILPTILRMTHPQHNFRWRVQERATGVMGALRSAEVPAVDRVLITFCDNVYGDERVEWGGYASVREVDNPQLDGWVEDTGWVKRDRKPTEKFAGWITCMGDDILSGHNNLIAWMNAHIDPILYHGKWYDIGTPESYEEYWT